MALSIKQSIKNVDGFFAAYFTSIVSPIFVWLFAKLRIRPNFVTFLSFVIGLGAAYCAGIGRYVLAAILIQAAFVFDCADGQLARYLNLKSKFGAWLDTITDRVKEFLILFAIAYSFATQNSYKYIFVLFFCALLVLAIRHYDLDKRCELGIFQDRTTEKSAPSNATQRFKAIIKESLLFGISERWALITICLLLNRIEIMFYLLIFYGLVVTLFKSIYSWKKFNKKNYDQQKTS